MKRIQVLIFLLLTCYVFAQKDSSASKNTATSWLQTFDFNPSLFKKPPLSFGPMGRWWWPGNYVTKDELKREINLFADNGFAGVEVQPMNLAIPTADEKEREKVTSWDTPEYYENLRTVMEEARRRNLIVDVSNGSGWPPAAPNLQPEDGFLSLEFSDTTVVGGKASTFALPVIAAGKNRTTVMPRLQAVVIAKLQQITPGEQPIRLDATSTRVLTSFVHNGSLSYSFPQGTWAANSLLGRAQW